MWNLLKENKMLKKIFWSIIRGLFSFIFLGSAFFCIKDFSLNSTQEIIGDFGAVLFLTYFGIICLRGTIENSKVFYKDKLNPFRKLDFKNWK